jgi:hypothetical protein
MRTLLDLSALIAHRIPTTDSDCGGYVSPNPGQAQEHICEHVQHRPTWASTAALPDHGINTARRVYVHSSYQGDNVSTVDITEAATFASSQDLNDGFEQQRANRNRGRWLQRKK